MKSFLKKLYALSVLFCQTIVSVISVLIFSKRFAMKQMNKLANSNNGDVIVLGNGPSLKTILSDKKRDLTSLGADLVAVNFFCSSAYFRELKPCIYIIADPAYFEPTNEEWIEKQKEKTIEALFIADWHIRLFIPASAKGSPLAVKLNMNKFIEIVYYNLVPVTAFKSIERYLFKKNLGMPMPENVLNCSIFLLINLRYKNIYLLGADHTWLKEVHVSDKNEVVMGYEHFYGDTNVVKLDSTLSQWLETQYLCFRNHDRLRGYADFLNINIFNSTEGSFIDAYERKIII